MTAERTPEFRLAVFEDLPVVNQIYNHYIEHSHSTFDLEPWSMQKREDWFAAFQPPWSLYVASEKEAGVVGFAFANCIRPKAAYNTSAETTIYLHPDYSGRGLGRPLLSTLLEQLESSDIHRAYAGIAMPNDASLALHISLGYEQLGRYSEVGFKFGKYYDTVWFEKKL